MRSPSPFQLPDVAFPGRFPDRLPDRLPVRFLLGCLSLAVAFAVAGCHGNPTQPQAQTATDQQYSSDPSDANVASVSDASSESYPAQPQGAYENQQAPPPQYNQQPGYGEDQSGDYTADEEDYGVQPEATAPQPPPPLPDYDQPPCPGPGYIWTPGYWYYGPAGYYWVPGAWVEAPYTGALWTPGYWAFVNTSYVFFPGYWGSHIGFYGGINYGFGYTGFGYHGGFWRNNQFVYNRTVNNINVSVVRNYYNYRVPSGGSRVSFNGGRGGVAARPRAAELAAFRQPVLRPMNTQLQLRQEASRNRAQFANVNRGRPSQAAWSRPVAAVRGARPTTMPVRNLPSAARPGSRPAGRPMQSNQPQRNTAPINRPQTQQRPPQPARPGTNRSTQRFGQAIQPQNRPQQQRTQPRPQPQRVQPRPQQRVQPQRVQPRPQPQHMQSRPQPQRQAPTRPAPTHTQPGHAERPRPQQHAPAPEHHDEHR